MLRLSGLVLFFLLLTGASTPALALGIPYPDPCSLYGLSTGAAASGDITPAQVAPLGNPGVSQYYIASGYGVFVCSTNLFINGSTAGLLNAIVFASNGNVGMSFNNAYNTVTGHTGGYYTPNPPAAKLDVSGLNATTPGPPGNGSYYGTTSPGGVRIGYDSAGCSSTNAGELIYTSSIIEYCNGSVWGALPTDATGTLGGTSPGVLVELTAGSAAAPSLTFYADTKTGIYQNPVDTMEITTNGTQSATFDASGNFSLTRGAYEINSITILGAPAVDQTGSLALGSGVLNSIFLTGTKNTGIGYQASTSIVAGSSDTAAGYQAMQYNWNSNDSTALGYQALQGTSATAITGSNNTAIGVQSLEQLTTGTNNTAVGYQALTKTTTGSGNTGAGSGAMYSNVTGSDSTAIGFQALYTSTAGPNTAAGYFALWVANSGTQNTAVGYEALSSLTTTSSNTAVGSTALTGTTGSGNTGAGYGSSANGSYNVSIGADSGNGGSYNTVVGYDALAAITGSYNVGVGENALLLNTSGNYNIAIGHSAQRYTGTGSSNIALGNLAMEGSSATPLSGSGNISFASSQASMQSTATGNIAALTNATSVMTTGSWNIGLGQGSLLDLTTGNYNTAIGEHALELDTTSSDNTAIGNTALANTTVGPNTAIGYIAGELATTGTNNASMGWEAGKGTGTYTGSYNIAVGSSSLTGITGAASHNTAAGYFTGASLTSGTSDNSLFGWKAGSLISSGSSNIAVGEAGNITSGGSNILIGNSLAGTTAATSYQLDIGDLIEGLTSSATSPNVSFEKALADASLSVQTPLTGFSITVGNGTGTLVLTPSGTLASGTITMPANPVKGQILRLASTATVTSLTLSANIGQSISNAISTITGATPVAYVYLASTTTWYRIQ